MKDKEPTVQAVLVHLWLSPISSHNCRHLSVTGMPWVRHSDSLESVRNCSVTSVNIRTLLLSRACNISRTYIEYHAWNETLHTTIGTVIQAFCDVIICSKGLFSSFHRLFLLLYWAKGIMITLYSYCKTDHNNCCVLTVKQANGYHTCYSLWTSLQAAVLVLTASNFILYLLSFM